MKRYRCPKGHEWEYKDRISVQVIVGAEKGGTIFHPCPVCWAQVVQNLPNGEEIASCEHCWHGTGVVYYKNPYQYEEYCCKCDTKRTRGPGILEANPALHGKYYRKGT